MKCKSIVQILFLCTIISCKNDNCENNYLFNFQLTPCTTFFENGNIEFIGYLNSQGEKEGMSEEYDSNGMLVWQGVYYKNERQYPANLTKRGVITFQLGDTTLEKGKISKVQIECKEIHPEDIVLEVSNANYRVVTDKNCFKQVYVLPTNKKDVKIGAFFPLKMGIYCKLSVRSYKVKG